MKENITYSPGLQHLFDIWHRATDSNDVNAQFYLACCFCTVCTTWGGSEKDAMFLCNGIRFHLAKV